jgi:hypothetical protein
MAEDSRLEQQRIELLRKGAENPAIAEGFRLFREAQLRVPAPTTRNTGQVRYSTSANH